MRTRELIRLMPTQFKRVSDNPLYTGHFIPILGYWTEEEGWVKKQDLEYESEVLSCPIIAVIDEKIGNKELVLTITGKQTQFKGTVERVDGIHTLKRKTYEDAGTTIETVLTIPRHTRPYGTFLITGLGQNIWGIQDVTIDFINISGKVSFYALASNGSKIIYWMGIHFLAEELRNILRPWIAPSKCTRCGGTGQEPDTEATSCYQCAGYRFSGYSAIKYVQRKIGFDVGLAREILDWDTLTDDDHKLIRKFINKAWTQKWWVTPTVKEIKRLFAHFYNVPEDLIKIIERFNPQEPVWKLLLPFYGSLASPFGVGEFTASDAELMEFIARSVTPAGVSVFVGFYRELVMGDMSDFSDALYVNSFGVPHSSLYPEYSLYGTPRIDFYNGWTKATDHFERETALGWDTNGDVSIVNVNDMNRHMVKLTDNAYMQTGISDSSGSFELWVHPGESEFKIGMRNDSDWMFYVEFDQNGFYDCNGYLIVMVKPYNDYHLSVDFNHSLQTFDVRIMRENVANGIAYLNAGPVSQFRIENYITGDAYIDAFGITEDPSYTLNDNWQRLHEFGWGINNDYYITGISGVQIDVRSYYRRDRFWDLNDY